MSAIREMLENQVFYRKLTAPEWNAIRGQCPNRILEMCLRSQEHADELKYWLRNSGGVK